LDVSSFTADRIRNFSIIAHIDHGKSTLADRLLEVTGTIAKSSDNTQVLDRLQVEKERGITVKAQTASLVHHYNGQDYLLNLIDTPGHVDFSYEVSRSLAACQGVILLIDANQGVQAQTVANFFLAFGQDLVIIPVLNKIDLKNANPDVVKEQINTAFDIDPSDVLLVSAKLGSGVDELLEAVINKIPPPPSDVKSPLRALLFDSWYDRYRGAIVIVAVVDGTVRTGDKLVSANTKQTFEVKDVGVLRPDEVSTGVLCAGQVGYLVAHMGSKDAIIGDTLHHVTTNIQPLPGFKTHKPMVFAGVFPMDQSQNTILRSSIERLTLNDASVTVNIDSSPALGQGWRLGFLGLLHMDVFRQRLEQEYAADVVVTSPNVSYKVKIIGEKNIKQYGGEVLTITNPLHLPDPTIISEYQEPMVVSTIITPAEFLGKIMGLCSERRGQQLDSKNLDLNHIMLQVRFPLNEIITDFFDDLKSVTSGYASFDYEDDGYRVSNLVKVTMLLNGRELEELTCIAHATRARTIGKQLCLRLRDTIPPQQFSIAIQAAIGGKIISRENIKAYRKDVTAKLYGGDGTRRMKLLKQQAEGKKRMRMIGNVEVPRDIFIKVLKKT